MFLTCLCIIKFKFFSKNSPKNFQNYKSRDFEKQKKVLQIWNRQTYTNRTIFGHSQTDSEKVTFKVVNNFNKSRDVLLTQIDHSN